MISVCIATHNGERYINEQLTSILPQLSESDEIIVSDDRSTDHTLHEITSLGDERIHIFTHDAIDALFTIDHSTHNFANALAQAKGDIIFLADQDDVWLPEKVQTFLKHLKTADLVMSDCYIGDDSLHTTDQTYSSIRPYQSGLFKNFLKSHYLGCCMAFKREVYMKAIPFPKHGVAHDLWIGMIAERFFNVQYINQPLMIYRRHSDTVTSSGKYNNTSWAFKIKYRFYIAKALIHTIISK